MPAARSVVSDADCREFIDVEPGRHAGAVPVRPFLHEVLPARQQRLSVTGWYRAAAATCREAAACYKSTRLRQR
jgi:hypothetical protein